MSDWVEWDTENGKILQKMIVTDTDCWGDYVMLEKKDDEEAMFDNIKASIKELMISARKTIEGKKYVEGSGRIIIHDTTVEGTGGRFFTVGCSVETKKQNGYENNGGG